MAEELDAIGVTNPPEVKVMVLLMSLPESYEFLVTSLESLESIDPNKLTWEVVATRLRNEELVKKEKFGSFELLTKTALVLAQKGSKFRVSRDKSRDICNYCKEVGHWARECKKKIVDSKKRGEKNNIIEARNEVISKETFVSSLSISCGSTMWYIDSSAFAHLSHERI